MVVVQFIRKLTIHIYKNHNNDPFAIGQHSHPFFSHCEKKKKYGKKKKTVKEIERFQYNFL